MAYAICDLQLLRGKMNEYVLKEVSFFEHNNQAYVHKSVTFSPPYPEGEIPEKQMRQNRYTVKHLHGLRWDKGFSPYDRVPLTLFEMAQGYDYLYVKGDDKAKILQYLLPTKQVYNVEKLGCPALKKLPVVWAPCENDVTSRGHRARYCAVRNAKRVGLWLEVYLNSLK